MFLTKREKVTFFLAELPASPTLLATTKCRHGLVCRPCLELGVDAVVLLAFGARVPAVFALCMRTVSV